MGAPLPLEVSCPDIVEKLATGSLFYVRHCNISYWPRRLKDENSYGVECKDKIKEFCCLQFYSVTWQIQSETKNTTIIRYSFFLNEPQPIFNQWLHFYLYRNIIFFYDSFYFVLFTLDNESRFTPSKRYVLIYTNNGKCSI